MINKGTIDNSPTKSGNNIFTGENVFKQNILQQTDSFSSNETPAENKYQTYLQALDRDGIRCGYVETVYGSNGDLMSALCCHRVVNDVDKWLNFRIGFDSLGVGKVDASTEVMRGITRWVVPNYSSGVSRSKNTEYTADTNGIFLVYGYRGDGTSQYLSIKINDIEVANAQMNDYNIYANTFFIKKGDKYKTSNPSGTYNLKFYPLIGG